MIIEKEINSEYLRESSWGGAEQTMQQILKEWKGDQLMFLLEKTFKGRANASEINNFLWFERDYIFECLGISDREEEEEEEEEEEK